MASGKKIVVIRQKSDMLDVLSSLNYKIMQAVDCMDGVRKTIRYIPDLILSDIDVPNLNGISMARILGLLQINVPVILTSFVEKYKKPSLALDNVIGFILNVADRSEESKAELRQNFETIINKRPERKLPEPLYKYHFRQHEWANLLGISKRRKILSIEDNPSFKSLVMKRLDTSDNYDLFSANDGLEGLCKALLIEPDLILTDIRMPVLDGMAMSQIFYILNKPFPIVFLTSIDDQNSRAKARKVAGVLGYMHKKVLRDSGGFLNEIEGFLNQAEFVKQSREEIYQIGKSASLEDF
ncbi:MAG: response regulator [SAR324 cluster bacterium]|nr:response regulator [SAR324 cluster bacterium]